MVKKKNRHKDLAGGIHAPVQLGLSRRVSAVLDIQGGFVFSLYLLHRKSQKFIEAERLGDYFIKVFPSIVSEAEETMPLDPEDNARHCFSLRFLVRFRGYPEREKE